MKRHEFFISGFLFIFAIILFFTHLSWGAPYFLHPDERNIAYSVSGLHFPDQLNPHFFAYGSLPIYCIYGIAVIRNFFFSIPHFSLVVSLDDAIISSRIVSSLLALGTIMLLFFVGRKLRDTTAGLLASFLGVFSVGFIQFAHFGTFEMWLTFFYLLLFYRFLFFLENKTIKNFISILVFASILLSVKISSLVFLIFPFSALIILLLEQRKRANVLFLKLPLLFIMISMSIFFLTNPFVFLDFPSFLSSITYESSVATGSLQVFYTGGFLGTVPVFYQLLHVYPFLLNPVLLVMGILSFIVINKKHVLSHRILTLFFLVYFLSQAFLFVKWTRYLMPSLPFIYLSISLFFTEIQSKLANSLSKKYLWEALFFLSISSSILWSYSYFITVFIHQDTRIEALKWTETHLSQKSRILSEAYDLGTMPFQSHFPKFLAFNFYDLDTNPTALSHLKKELETSDFLLLPSQRVIKNRLSNHKSFPIGYTFYASLNKEKTFEKVYETPCDFYCRVTYLGSPIFNYEETASVFDRPTIQIYRIHEK